MNEKTIHAMVKFEGNRFNISLRDVQCSAIECVEGDHYSEVMVILYNDIFKEGVTVYQDKAYLKDFIYICETLYNTGKI